MLGYRGSTIEYCTIKDLNRGVCSILELEEGRDLKFHSQEYRPNRCIYYVPLAVPSPFLCLCSFLMLHSPPQKIFDHHATPAGAQIINYQVTPDEKWLVLISVSRNSNNPSVFKVNMPCDCTARIMVLASQLRDMHLPLLK
jgi:hypothetical protein